MPSPFSHGIASIALGKAFSNRQMPLRFWALSIFCSVIPDIDILGNRLGIGFWTVLGHRGLTHSILFAISLSCLVVLLAFRKPIEGITRRGLLAYFFAVTISHGILDALVNGVLGVAFFAPFNSIRYFLPWRPIHSSPIGMAFFSSTGWMVIVNELIWVWAPSLTVIFARWLFQRFADRSEPVFDEYDAVVE